MYGFKKFLVGLIPQAVLAISLFICSFVVYGPMAGSEVLVFAVAGFFMGVVILVSYLNDEDIHTFWKVICWIGFAVFGLLALLILAKGFIRDEAAYGKYPLLDHISVGLLFSSSLTLIYLFVVLKIRVWEDYSLVSKLIAPTAILIVGTIAGGFISLGGSGFVTVMSYVFEFAPIVAIVVMLILFIRFHVYVGSYGSSNYSSGNSSRSSSSSSSRAPTYAEIYKALIGTTASYSSGGCTVYLGITNVYVSNGSVTYDYEKR